MSDLPEALAAVVRSYLDDLAIAAALGMRIGDMQERLHRIEHRAEKKRAVITAVMERADIKKLSEPDFSAALRAVPPGLVVSDEREIPALFWKPQPPKLDRRGLLTALTSGQAIPGAGLGNGSDHPSGEDEVKWPSPMPKPGCSPASSMKSMCGPARSAAFTLSYIEAWHAIDEANRVFGFEGWDRETIAAECVWVDGRRDPKACAYTARVRIRVRAGDTVVSRDGSGVGHGTGATLGDAHESALKEAETDATKRALTTFGNLFGLALYDKAQNGVRRSPKPNGGRLKVSWALVSPQGELLGTYDVPQDFCAALREAIATTSTAADLEALWSRNEGAVGQLRAVFATSRPPRGCIMPTSSSGSIDSGAQRSAPPSLIAATAPGRPNRQVGAGHLSTQTHPGSAHRKLTWLPPLPHLRAQRRAMRTTFASPSPARWEARSATNGPCRSAALIIGRSTTSATRSTGGRSTASTPRPRPRGCGRQRHGETSPVTPPEPLPLTGNGG